MAMDRSSRPMHRGRKKVCSFCVDRVEHNEAAIFDPAIYIDEAAAVVRFQDSSGRMRAEGDGPRGR